MTFRFCSSSRSNGSVGLSLPSATFFAVTVVVSAVFVSSRSFTSITVYASPGELTVTDSVSNEAYTPSWGAPRLEPLSKSYIAKSTRSGVTGSPVSESTSEKRSPTSVPVCTLIWPKPLLRSFCFSSPGVYSLVDTMTRSIFRPSAAVAIFLKRISFSLNGRPARCAECRASRSSLSR